MKRLIVTVISREGCNLGSAETPIASDETEDISKGLIHILEIRQILPANGDTLEIKTEED